MNRMVPRWRQPSWLSPRQERARATQWLYETAWADAWPHLDNWFQTETFLRTLDGLVTKRW